MDSSPYGPFLEKIRLPQPALQRSAVTALFSKLRSASPHIALDSPHGRDALSLCLASSSPAVADQAVHELLRLVATGSASVDLALLELQSTLEGCTPLFVPLFVKGIGFLCRFVFHRDPLWGRSRSPSVELHPFVKVLSCRPDAHEELIRQVVLFVVHNRTVGMDAVSVFLRPFIIFSILRIPYSVRSSVFAKDLVCNLASLSCSLPSEAIAVIRLLTRCLEYFPSSNEEEFKLLTCSAEYLVDAFLVVFQQIVKTEEAVGETRACCVELLESLLLICTDLNKSYREIFFVVELLTRLLNVQRQLGLPYLADFSSVMFSVPVIFSHAHFEHEHICVLKLSALLTGLMYEGQQENIGGSALYIPQLLPQIFPIVNVLSSSSSKSTTDAVISLLIMFKAHLTSSLTASRDDKNLKARYVTKSKLGSIIRRLLHHLWAEDQDPFDRSFTLDLVFKDKSKERHKKTARWFCLLKDYTLSLTKKSKVMLTSHFRQNMTVILSSIAASFMHQKYGSLAIESLVSLCTTDPRFSMAMLLMILFYHSILCTDGYNSPITLLKLLEMLPALASSSAMVPFIHQILMRMLQKDTHHVLYATAVRLLCKTWIVTDRVFGSLQEVLDPKAFSVFTRHRDICISIAVSIRDVCRNNPDRGVDIILSVSSCIESRDSYVQAVGFEALSYLCEADVVDFYTAWDVVKLHILDYSADPVVAHGLSVLLQWGATDVDAYLEASNEVLHILWDIGNVDNSHPGQLWLEARVSAFESLCCYQVEHVCNVIPDVANRILKVLVSVDNTRLLRALEGFVIRIVKFEHINRRRLQVKKDVKVHKVEKLLDLFPRAIFSSGTKHESDARELPGASLLCATFTPKLTQTKDLSKLHGIYEAALLEMAESLQLSRNVFIALLALQSWEAFISRWMKAASETKAMAISDENHKLAHAILKILQRLAENSIPRVTENIILSIGALCMVVTSTGHSAIYTASNFLLKWLFQYEHEHRQWPAAISLGVVLGCLHTTDRATSDGIINGLLEVIVKSTSNLVKGACGIGLGFACQHLLTGGHNDLVSEGWLTDAGFVRKIVHSLVLIISRTLPSSYNSLICLIENFMLDESEAQTGEFACSLEYSSDEQDDSWGVAGLIIGLGNTVSALYRLGAYDSILNIKDILTSYIQLFSLPSQGSHEEVSSVPLSMGSCLVLPTICAFCQKTELADIDLPVLVNGYQSLISNLLAIETSGVTYQNLLMASLIGAGSLLSCILSEGVCSIKLVDVKCLLEAIRSTYTHPHSPVVQVGGMFGVVNAFGAGAGNLGHMYQRPYLKNDGAQKDLRYIKGAILANPVLESFSTSLVQEIFVIAKESKDIQLRKYAAWAISYLRHWWWSKYSQSMHDQQSGSLDNNVVSGLYSWLNGFEQVAFHNINIVVSTLRCLSQAPRLPSSSDWGAIIKRCMKLGPKLSENAQALDQETKILRKECLHFALAHASVNNSLMTFMDDLADGPRFNTLDLNLQCSLLCFLSEIKQVFSKSRLEKLYADLVWYFSSSKSFYMLYNDNQKCLLRAAFWTGLKECLANASDKSICISELEKCMHLLFSFLPVASAYGSVGTVQFEEFAEAANCLSLAPQIWLIGILQVPKMELINEEGIAVEVARKIMITARLIMIGCLPVSELGKLKACILNLNLEGTWFILMEVAGALYGADSNTKRQWLLDAIQISCVARYPSTALQFAGLLSSLCCEYMPLLLLNPVAVLSDLPVTIPSLLSDGNWSDITGRLVENLWVSTERICSWATRLRSGKKISGADEIDESENERSVLLVHVLQQTCLSVRSYLPLEKQLRLANTVSMLDI